MDLQAPAGQYDYFPKAPNNQWTVNPVENTTYTLTINGPGNSTAQDQVTISVVPPSIPIFNVQPQIYTAGQQVAFTWVGESAVSAKLTPDPGKSYGRHRGQFHGDAAGRRDVRVDGLCRK